MLIVEHSETSAQALIVELERGGYQVNWQRVDRAETLLAALRQKRWQLVLAGLGLPGFTPLAALTALKQQGLDLPFVIIADPDEDLAVSAMKAGAHDALVRGQLERLVPIVERELAAADARAERAEARAQLVRSDRLASLGTVTAGVAHDINNPLSVTVANLDFVVRELTALRTTLSPEARDRLSDVLGPLNDARQASQREKEIVRDLTLFAGSDDEPSQQVNVHDVLDLAVRLTANQMSHRARLLKRYGPTVLIDGNPSMLARLLVNLLGAAAQAMPGGQAEQHQVSVGTRAEGGRAVIEIRGNGPEGQGSEAGALILSICQRLVADLEGELTVAAAEPGTLFTVRLPMAEALPRGARVLSAPQPGAEKRGRVLIIDDEPMVAYAVERTLAKLHEVTVLTDARVALQQIIGGERFDAVVCDLMMPQFSGEDFYVALKAAVPQQAERILFLTGGAFTPQARAFLTRSPCRYLEKPFEATELTRALAALISG